MNQAASIPSNVNTEALSGISLTGTVVWVGSIDHPEFSEAFQYFQSAAPQLAIRRDQQEFLRRPASDVQWIIFARVRRVALLPAVAPEIQLRYPNAKVLVINGSLCDGERRSGYSWKPFAMKRFDRWCDGVKLEVPTRPTREVEGTLQPMTLLLFDRFIDAEPWLAIVRSQACPALWSRRFDPLTMTNVQRMVWDESIAPKSSSRNWSQILASCESAIGCEHHWLVTQPQTDDISYAMHAGVSAVHSKPLWDVSFLVASGRGDSERD